MLRPDVAAFWDAPTGSIQYAVSDPQTRRCAIIDPVQDFGEKSGSTTTPAFRAGAWIGSGVPSRLFFGCQTKRDC
jgi:hypothetical protein